METWHPRAIPAAANKMGGFFTGQPFKIVLHTTETSGYAYDPSSYYGNPYWPHATIDENGIHQHLPIDVSAYALYHGTVQTNNANAIQCEIVWRAGDIEDIPQATLANVADWVRWVSEQTGAPLVGPSQGWGGSEAYGEDGPYRFTDQEWLAYSGVCGHQHVPSGNDHWDPGRFPIDRLLSAVGPKPPPKEDDGMAAWQQSDSDNLHNIGAAWGDLRDNFFGPLGANDDGSDPKWGRGMFRLANAFRKFLGIAVLSEPK